MAYDKTIWLAGDLITSARMNNIEDGLETIFTQLDGITSEDNNIIPDVDNKITLNASIHALGGIVLKDSVTGTLYELKISDGTVLFNSVG